jgi:penicillin-binding protein 1A
MYAADVRCREFAKEWREVVPTSRSRSSWSTPRPRSRITSSFEHGGIYFKGTPAPSGQRRFGDFAQGGTITQQVAKQFLGTDKSLARKAREAIMARRLEARYSKKAILSLYLNHIYLGAGAYGVAAAAHRYFQKELTQLTLAEMALLAGLPKAPSAFSPITNPARAIDLDWMEVIMP